SFSGSGTFTSTGTIQVTLYGTGTPGTGQTDNFTATADGSGGTCTFSVSVIGVFTCGSPFIYGGQSYNTVQIGLQCWMAENLNIGTMVNGSANQTDNSIIEKYCYNDIAGNCDEYGGLYQWHEMMQYGSFEGAEGICPAGWHLPADNEWCILENHVDAGFVIACNSTLWRGTDAGGNLKESGTTHWSSPNSGATNSSGFTGLPGGSRHMVGSFISFTQEGSFWSSSTVGINAWFRKLNYSNSQVWRYTHSNSTGLSVRCVMTETVK
ncbi:MAG: hypothetical protein DRJ05_12730, partial [Bacteroidetes bacterium]